MPSPLELIFNPVSYIVFAIYATLMLWEFLFPARVLPQIKWWRTRGMLSFICYFFLSSYLPLWWDGKLAALQLFNLAGVNLAAQVVIGLFAYELVAYAYHRSMHRFTPLWRAFHQMHHSAERLDTFGAFWFSPLDMVGFTFVGSFAFVVVAGLEAQAAVIVLLITMFLAIFQHANIRTPRWLGYFIQRPESHSFHHGRGRHRDNYSDLPVIDIVFGSFYNPHGFSETGFYDGASSRVPEMLLWQDVYKPREEVAKAGLANDGLTREGLTKEARA
ncbi:MAG: fatty acid hydroxylase [Gammaproteobacteria bacterium RIFCSPLOWO2_02_FULL_57_10]|nr:MAG: fatty acid hydroxylase [Gammaproteobacteria bacterium RIFCSPLOWO2_02_FULL_57_10]